MTDLPLNKHDRDDRWLDIGKHAVAGDPTQAAHIPQEMVDRVAEGIKCVTNFDTDYCEEIAIAAITALLATGEVVRRDSGIINRIKDKSWCDVNYDDRIISLSELWLILKPTTKGENGA